jgi:hypothetical protein
VAEEFLDTFDVYQDILPRNLYGVLSQFAAAWINPGTALAIKSPLMGAAHYDFAIEFPLGQFNVLMGTFTLIRFQIAPRRPDQQNFLSIHAVGGHVAFPKVIQFADIFEHVSIP